MNGCADLLAQHFYERGRALLSPASPSWWGLSTDQREELARQIAPLVPSAERLQMQLLDLIEQAGVSA